MLSCRRHIFTSQHGKSTSYVASSHMSFPSLPATSSLQRNTQYQKPCCLLVDTEWKPQIPNGRISPAQLYIECAQSPCDWIGVVNQSLPIQCLPVSVERWATLSCWVQLPLLLRGMVTSTFARSRVMAGVTSITLARPSCITTAATSAFWVGSHACSKGLAPLGWLQHRTVALQLVSKDLDFLSP